MKCFAILLLFFGLLTGSKCQIDEGDPCEVDSVTTGTCELYSKCKNRIQGRPNICSYTVVEAIVCCPPTVVTKRKVVAKCDEYTKHTTTRAQIATLNVSPKHVSTLNIPTCDYSARLIVGGEITKVGEFPHMAVVGWLGSDNTYDFACGGSLISDYYVLTAAHCATNHEGVVPVVVRLGEQNLVKDDDGAEPANYNIADFIKHPNYKPVKAKYNDIALIRLATQVKFTKFIRPACLWPSYSFNVTKAIATGFGATENFGDKSNELLKVSLDIYSRGQCQQTYARDQKLSDGIINSQICCGVLEGGRDTCQGDSGGPLQVTLGDNQCAFYLVGITSFGKTCGGINSPAIYTRVFSYLDWIESIVWE